MQVFALFQIPQDVVKNNGVEGTSSYGMFLDPLEFFQKSFGL